MIHPNLNYELQELERILSTQKLKGVNELSSSHLRDTVSSEVERIKKTLVYEVFHLEDERHLERYIQYHQQALIGLIDRTNFLLREKVTSNQRKVYDTLYVSFDDLLTYIERHLQSTSTRMLKRLMAILLLRERMRKATLKNFKGLSLRRMLMLD